MTLPPWVIDEITKFQPPTTGRVEIKIVLEMYMGGVSKMEIGGLVRTISPGPSAKLKPKAGETLSQGNPSSLKA